MARLTVSRIIGEYYENLIVWAEKHLKKAYEITDHQEGTIDDKMLRAIFSLDIAIDKEKLENFISLIETFKHVKAVLDTETMTLHVRK